MHLKLSNGATGGRTWWTIALITFLLLVGCGGDGDGNGAPAVTATPTRTATTPAQVCASIAPSSPVEDSVLDLLAAVASTRGDFDPGFAAGVSDDRAGTPADLTFEIIARDRDVHHVAFYITIPDAWAITPGCAVPLGTIVGSLTWRATLGILNSPCKNDFPIAFDMQNASTDASDVIDFVDDSGNLVDGFEEDKDNSGLADVVEKYPDVLTELFPGRTPGRRSVGIARVSGMPVITQALVFPPQPGLDGQTLVILFQDFANVRETVPNSPISDQCTPFTLAMTNLGSSEGGDVLVRTPPAGSYTFGLTAYGLRDGDGDGTENALDTCPFDANVGDPRITGNGDADQDGLDAACDPDDFTFNSDEDGDKHLNRTDFCPLTPNPGGSGPQRDGDADQIGDECDIFGSGPEMPDGELPLASEASDVVIR